MTRRRRDGQVKTVLAYGRGTECWPPSRADLRASRGGKVGNVSEWLKFNCWSIYHCFIGLTLRPDDLAALGFSVLNLQREVWRMGCHPSVEHLRRSGRGKIQPELG